MPKKNKRTAVQLSLLEEPKVLVKLTELEVNRNIFIVGHRLIPIQNKDTFPWQLTIKNDAQNAFTTTTISLSLKDISIYYNLYGNEMLIPLLTTQDEANVSIINLNGTPATNIIVRAQVVDMGTYYKDHSLSAGDYLELQSIDEAAQSFVVHPVKAQDISTESQSAFFAAMDEAVSKAIQELKTPQDPATMIRAIFQKAWYHGSADSHYIVYEKPAASFSEYYNKREKLQMYFVHGKSYLWEKGIDIESLLPEPELNLAPSKTAQDLDDTFHALGLSLHSYEIEAFIKDALYYGDDLDSALQRCFIGLDLVGYTRSEIQNLMSKARPFAEEIAKKYQITDEPKEFVTLRSRLLSIYEKFLYWMRSIDVLVESEKDLQNDNFYTLSEIMGNLSSSLLILNHVKDNPLVEHTLQSIQKQIDSIEQEILELMYEITAYLESKQQKKKAKKTRTKTSTSKRNTKKRPASKKNYVLSITIADIKPSIYRKVLIPGNRTLEEVSDIILAAFGWDNYHSHLFKIRNEFYGAPSEDDWEPIINERKVRFDDLELRKRSKGYLIYDFGDSWEHIFEVVDITQAAPEKEIPPFVFEGNRACPIEDSGGIPGYYRILEVMAKSEQELSPEDRDLLQWIPKGYDPEYFDIHAANTRLKDM